MCLCSRMGPALFWSEAQLCVLCLEDLVCGRPSAWHALLLSWCPCVRIGARAVVYHHSLCACVRACAHA